MIYRIYTEDTNRPATLRLASDYFDGFTTYFAVGYWQRTPEPSLVIEIVTEAASLVASLAEAIRVLNRQDAVLVVALTGNVTMVTAPATAPTLEPAEVAQ